MFGNCFCSASCQMCILQTNLYIANWPVLKGPINYGKLVHIWLVVVGNAAT